MTEEREELAAIGERLQREHGTLWLHRLKGDPYAALLCDVDDDPAPLRERVRAVGPLWRSGAGVWVTADPRTAATLFAHPGIGHQTAPPEELLGPGEETVTPVRVQKGLGPLCARLLDAAGPEFDLVTELAEPLAAAALAEACAIPERERGRFAEALAACEVLQDATVAPQRLAATRRLRTGLDALRSLLDGAPPGAPGPLALAVAARTGADLVARAVLRAPFPLSAREAGRAAEEVLRAEPPGRIAPLVARTETEVAGARIAGGDRLAVLLGGGAAEATAPAHRTLAPFHRALAESALTALADRRAMVRPTAPVVRRARAPLTRGPARAPVVVTPVTATGPGGSGTTTTTTADRRTDATTTPTVPPEATPSPRAAAAALGARRGEAR